MKKNEHLKIKKYKNCFYFGVYKDNCRDDIGVLVFNNGRIYEGNWDKDQKTGKGIEIFPNNGRYDG